MKTIANSDTPRTDAHIGEVCMAGYVSLEFARTLERELAAMTAERDALKERGSALAKNVLSPLRPHWSETQMLAQMFLSSLESAK